MKLPNKLLLTVLCLALTACSLTVTPNKLKDSTPSYDAGQLNSGLIGFYTNTESVYMVVTPHLRDRYNALIPTYGTNFLPALKPDAGVKSFTNGTYLLDLEALVKFNTMNRLRKSRL